MHTSLVLWLRTKSLIAVLEKKMLLKCSDSCLTSSQTVLINAGYQNGQNNANVDIAIFDRVKKAIFN